METKRKMVVVGVALGGIVLGIALEQVRQQMFTIEEPMVPEQSRSVPVAKPVRNVQDGHAEREVVQLRRQVAELERRLAEKEETIPEPAPPPQVTARPEGERRGRPDFSERLAQMKKDNPEQYAEWMKRRDEFRTQMAQVTTDRANFLETVDVKNMTPAQRENHEKIVSAVNQFNQLMALASDPEAEGAHDARHALFETANQLRGLYKEERTYLFEELGRYSGYTGEKAAEFSGYIQMILDNTSMQMPHLGRAGVDRGMPHP